MDGVRIIINTRGRVDEQFTLQNLVPELRKEVSVICYPGEKKFLDEIWEGEVKEIIEHPISLNFIGEIRQWSLDNSDEDYIIFLDDNINFHARYPSEKGESCKFPLHQLISKHFYDSTIYEIQLEMIFWMIEKLFSDNYGIVGISARTGNSRVLDRDEVENTRCYAFWGINNKMLKILGNRKFSDVKLKEDFYILLHFLTNGIPNIVSYKFAFGKCKGANSKGGCSTYRTVEESNKSAYILQNYFPDFVRLTDKKTKSWGGDFGDKSLDVVISWKKAYEFGVNQLNNI